MFFYGLCLNFAMSMCSHVNKSLSSQTIISLYIYLCTWNLKCFFFLITEALSIRLKKIIKQMK